MAFFAPVLWWVERVGVDAWVLLVAVEAAFAALFALAAGPVLAHPRPIVGPWDGPVCGSWCSRQLGPGSPWEAFPGDRSALPWWGLLSSA